MRSEVWSDRRRRPAKAFTFSVQCFPTTRNHSSAITSVDGRPSKVLEYVVTHKEVMYLCQYEQIQYMNVKSDRRG